MSHFTFTFVIFHFHFPFVTFNFHFFTFHFHVPHQNWSFAFIVKPIKSRCNWTLPCKWKIINLQPVVLSKCNQCFQRERKASPLHLFSECPHIWMSIGISIYTFSPTFLGLNLDHSHSFSISSLRNLTAKLARLVKLRFLESYKTNWFYLLDICTFINWIYIFDIKINFHFWYMWSLMFCSFSWYLFPDGPVHHWQKEPDKEKEIWFTRLDFSQRNTATI